ncbi:hypothetical protein Taro_044873 [Colocasia esculenta]|uniref:Uncharacterized protein n=1 Tax=Colocasia esculenta TaxID=4460 RepID=A0A843WVN1_COLES|nr:hypothetical protein [Colocasia esculenta]
MQVSPTALLAAGPTTARVYGYFTRVTSVSESIYGLYSKHFCRCLAFHFDSFSVQLPYFITISLVGYLLLEFLEPSNQRDRPKISATTVSSMGTVEMEVFSDAQLWILIFFMLVGGEVFVSMLSLHLMHIKFKKNGSSKKRTNLDTGNFSSVSSCSKFKGQMESGTKIGVDLGFESTPDFGNAQSDDKVSAIYLIDEGYLKHSSIRCLRFVIMGYLALILVGVSLSVSLYLSMVQSVAHILKSRGISISTFSIFTVASSFGNCGFIPTNENMAIFKKNSGLPLLITPQILFGNTLFPPCLRLVIMVLKKLTKRKEFDYILDHCQVIGCAFLLPQLHCVFLFLVVQTMRVYLIDWNSDAPGGLSMSQKLIGAIFQSVNSRHAGESVVDLSMLSSAILVLYMLMMLVPSLSLYPFEAAQEFRSHRTQSCVLYFNLFYRYLPSYTLFLPKEDYRWPQLNPKQGNKLGESAKSLIFSHLSYLAIAYGNVGFSIGYSCKRLLNSDSNCKDARYGFLGRWSNKGKLVLILAMFYGRVKRFNTEGGSSWELGYQVIYKEAKQLVEHPCQSLLRDETVGMQTRRILIRGNIGDPLKFPQPIDHLLLQSETFRREKREFCDGWWLCPLGFPHLPHGIPLERREHPLTAVHGSQTQHPVPHLDHPKLPLRVLLRPLCEILRQAEVPLHPLHNLKWKPLLPGHQDQPPHPIDDLPPPDLKHRLFLPVQRDGLLRGLEPR